MVQLLSSSGRILILFIQIYKILISPLFKPKCRFTPTCSNYGIEAIRRFGITKGCWLMTKRILKCHPLHQGGEDPVPRIINTREH